MYVGYNFSVLGAVLIVLGLYSVLWGKYKEYKEKELAESFDIPQALKAATTTTTGDIADLQDIEIQKSSQPNNKEWRKHQNLDIIQEIEPFLFFFVLLVESDPFLLFLFNFAFAMYLIITRYYLCPSSILWKFI